MAIFDEKIEIRERCKGGHCVDLGESFQTHICLQNLASIQPLERALQSLPYPVTRQPQRPHLNRDVVAGLPAELGLRSEVNNSE